MQVDNLKTYSIIKAHNEVNNSARARIFKAVPTIATALIGTGLALTQPGKLATKAATGLGFLALSSAFNKTSDAFYKSDDDKKTIIKKDIAATAGVILAATGAVSLAKKAANTTKIGGFIKKEIGTLAKEINSTKLAKFLDKTVEPFLNEHVIGANIAAILAAFGITLGANATQVNLSKSLGQEFKQKANENYAKGKLLQELMQQGLEA